MKKNNSKENQLIQKHNIEDFAAFCIEGNIDLVNEYIRNNYIDDLTYDDGYFAVIAATKGHLDILKALYEAEPKLQNYNIDILNVAALNGQEGCTKYLLYNQKANPSELINTTSYNNYSFIQELFDNYLHTHQSDNNSDDLHHSVEYTGADSNESVHL